MIDVANIKRIRNENQESTNLYIEHLKEMVNQGEMLLKRYSDANNTPDLLEIEKNICDDFKIDLKPERSITLTSYKVHKRNLIYEDARYSYIYQNDISSSKRKTGLAYTLGIIIFDKFNQNQKDELINFDFPCNSSVDLTPGELAFVYSLIIPYTTYKQYLIDFCAGNYEGHQFNNNQEWIHYLSCMAPCDLETASVISAFYSNLYFKEISEIWRNYSSDWEDFYYTDKRLNKQ